MTTLFHIAEWDFHPESTPVLSSTSKITAAGGLVRLRLAQPAALIPGHPSQVYPIDDDVYVRTKQFSPGSLVSWGFVELIGEEPKDEDTNAVTSLSVRLYTGSVAQYWNGAAWANASAGDWNTITDFNANLNSYLGTSIAFEVRLKTTDNRFTPTLTNVKLKWNGESFSFFNEWIYRTVVPSMKASIRPVSDYTLEAPGGTSIDLNSFPLDAGFEITDVLNVYDHTNDSTHSTDLFSSYDSGTKVITLTGAIALDDTAWIVLRYSPQVAVTTSTDYTEESKVPAIWITGVRNPVGSNRRVGNRGPSIVDRSLTPPLGVVFPNPIPLVTLDITYAVLSSGALDLNRLNEALIHWIEIHPVLISPALDTSVRLQRRTVMDWSTGRSNAKEPVFLTGTFTLVDLPLIGDVSASAADGSNTSTPGAIEAGDPNHPGIGYGVSRANFVFQVAGGTGEDSVIVTE